jgi:hypothetical protein
MWLTGGSILESGEQRSSRQPRSDFTVLVAADSIGNHEQPTMSPRSCRRVRNCMA